MYKIFLKPLLFQLDPEKAHKVVTGLFNFMGKIPGVRSIFRALYCVNDKRLERELFGIKFPNPVGLAAGFDKEATLYNSFTDLGFGFVEIGTITPLGQAGNPKPRLFRLPSDEALVNRMGFNNAGMEVAAERLKNRNKKVIVGGNIGKNKVTPNENAVDDYEKCFNTLFPYVNYFVVNVSSPNTPNLRELQDKEPLTKLLLHLQAINDLKEKPKPILLKIAPDLSNDELDDIVEIVETAKIAGLIATNTTISRAGLNSPKELVNQAGGLSGKPVEKRSTEVIRYIHKKSEGRIPIIGVGGIHSAEDALQKLDAGASLVQVYTGFIYEGPALIKKINQAILARS